MNTKALAIAVLIGALSLGSGVARAAETQADWSTTLKVKLSLLNQLGTDSLKVEVDSNAGALTLTGMVMKRETRELAETIAKSVGGVESVKNDIELASSEADPNKAGVMVGEVEAEVKDAVLVTKVRMALIDKMGTDGFKIGAAAANGVVTLRFSQEFAADRRTQATKVARNVSGVSSVISVRKS